MLGRWSSAYICLSTVASPSRARSSAPLGTLKTSASTRLGADHVVHPASQDYPSPYLYDPLISLTWAAAVTERVRLGTSVMVLRSTTRSRSPTPLASLDACQEGGSCWASDVGWSAAEFAALG